jgi:CsoR family transcriptional regulator, copper-sensing transcriptional repressor
MNEVCETHKNATLKRLNRIAGQVNGVARMIDEGRYCIDVLNQIQAVKAALGKVEDQVLRDHAASCVEAAIETGDTADQRDKFNELVDLFGKVKR